MGKGLENVALKRGLEVERRGEKRQSGQVRRWGKGRRRKGKKENKGVLEIRRYRYQSQDMSCSEHEEKNVTDNMRVGTDEYKVIFYWNSEVEV